MKIERKQTIQTFGTETQTAAITATRSEPKVGEESKDVKAEKSHDGRKKAEDAMRQSRRGLYGLAKGLKKHGVNPRGIGRVEVNAPSTTVSAEKYDSKVKNWNKRVGANGKAQDERKNATKEIERSLRKLSHLVTGLKKIGVNSREITKVVESTNREVNKAIGKEIKKAYNDYRTNKIDKQSLHNMLYGTAAKKLEGMTSALKKTFDQRLSSVQGKTESTKSIETPAYTVAKEEDVLSGIVADVTRDIEVISLDDNRSLDKMFDKVIDFFNDIDKMINGFADKAEGKGSDEDKGGSLLNFVSRLNEMFSGINKAFGRHGNDNVGHRLGMAQVKKETVRKLFDSGHGNGAINSIGGVGEGSGNFNAISFMSSLSNNINDALDNYKEVQEAEQEAQEESNEG